MRRSVTVVIAALMLVGSATDVSAKLSSKQKDELNSYVEKLAETTDAEAQHALLLVRGATADAKVRKELAAMESNEDARVRLGAKLASLLAGDRKAVDRVATELLAQGADYGLLRWSLAPLDDAAELKVVEAVLKAAKPDQLSGVFRYLATTYGKLFDRLVSELDGKDAAQRQLAAKEIVQADRAEVLAAAGKLMKSKDEQIRFEIVQLVSEFSKRNASQADAKKLLAVATKDSASRIKELAARRLVALKDNGGSAVLIELAKSAPKPETAASILTFLLENDVRPKSAALAGWLESDNADLKRRAYQLTAANKDKKFVDKLLEMHSSVEFEDRLLATQALGYTKDDRAVAPLTASLFEARNDIRKAAAESLVELASPATLDALKVSLTKERDAEIKLTVVDAIGAVGGKDALQLLRFQVTSNDIELKKRTVEAIRTMGMKDGARALDILLRDRNFDVRWRAFLATLSLDPKQAENHFGSVFRNPPAGFMSDLLELAPAKRKLALEYLLKNGAGSARDAAIRVAKSEGNDEVLYEIAMSSTADLSTRKDLVQYFGARGQKKDLMVLETLARGKDPTLARLAAWMLTRHPATSLEASYRGYLASKDETLRAIAAYGLATVWQ